jgi:PBSX family phage terminase large subunit
MNFQVTNVFKKNEKAIADGYRYIINSGGSRSSKSYSICQLLVIMCLTNKNYKISCFRNLRIDCIGTIGEDIKAIIASEPTLQSQFTYNIKDGIWKCKTSSSTIHLQGSEKLSKALGMKNNLLYLNEISEFSKEVFDALDQRTTDLVLVDYNPSKEFYIESYRNNKNAIFLHSTYKDNAFLTDGIVNKLESYNPWEIGSTYVEDRKVYHDGNPVTDTNVPPPNILNVKNQTADKFNYEVYCLGLGSEKPNRVYKNWKKCTDSYFDDLEYTSYYGLDFGISSPTAMVEVKYDGDRTFYLHQRLYKPSSTMGMPIYEWIKTMLDPEIGSDELIVCDSAKKTMVQEIALGGLMAVSALKGAGSIAKRINQMQSFNIIYTESSLDLENEYYEYSYKTDRYGLTTDDIDPTSEDHILDATGYCISYLISWLGIVFK